MRRPASSARAGGRESSKLVLRRGGSSEWRSPLVVVAEHADERRVELARARRSVLAWVMSPVWTTRSTRAAFSSSTIRRTFGRWLWVSLTTPMRMEKAVGTVGGSRAERTGQRHRPAPVIAGRPGRYWTFSRMWMRAGAAEADHVRQAELRALDLPLAGLAAQVRRHLVDVGDAGRAERVALREQPARDVHRDLAAERDRAARRSSGPPRRPRTRPRFS